MSSTMTTSPACIHLKLCFYHATSNLSLSRTPQHQRLSAHTRSIRHRRARATATSLSQSRTNGRGGGSWASARRGSSLEPDAGDELPKRKPSQSTRSTVFSLDQAFPVTRRLSLEKKLSSQLVQAAELEVRDVERRYIAEAKTLAVKLLALDQHLVLHRQQMELARKLSTFAKERAAAGEVSALDAAQAQVDLQRLLLETRKMEAETLGLRGALKPMLGIATKDSLTLTGDLTATRLPGHEFMAATPGLPTRPNTHRSRPNRSRARQSQTLAGHERGLLRRA